MNNNIIEKIKAELGKEFPFNGGHVNSYLEILEYQEEFQEDIYDEIHETADNMTLIYNKDLLAWLNNSWEWSNRSCLMEDVVNEGLIDMKNYNFFKHIMTANYQYHWNLLSKIHQKAVAIFESIEEEV